MDKWELESMITAVIESSDSEWNTVRDVREAIQERFGKVCLQSTVRGRMDSLVNFSMLESREERVSGHITRFYRKKVMA